MKAEMDLGTDKKAFQINLDAKKYGTFAEIGAGQEVARRFFHVGGAAGTVAKTMSAYDMTFSDAIYGPTDPDHAPPFSDMAQALSLRLDCAPCRQRECPLGHHNCMRNLTPGMVWEPLKPMLEAQACRR